MCDDKAARQALGLDQPEVTEAEEEEWQRKAEQKPAWAGSVPEGVEKYSDYYKDVRHLSHIDVYRAVDLFGCERHGHPISHAAKKLLLSGVRTGGKSVEDDVREAIDTLRRWLKMREEDRNAL